MSCTCGLSNDGRCICGETVRIEHGGHVWHQAIPLSDVPLQSCESMNRHVDGGAYRTYVATDRLCDFGGNQVRVFACQ